MSSAPAATPPRLSPAEVADIAGQLFGLEGTAVDVGVPQADPSRDSRSCRDLAGVAVRAAASRFLCVGAGPPAGGFTGLATSFGRGGSGGRGSVVIRVAPSVQALRQLK
jgi:hypothetical protein